MGEGWLDGLMLGKGKGDKERGLLWEGEARMARRIRTLSARSQSLKCGLTMKLKEVERAYLYSMLKP